MICGQLHYALKQHWPHLVVLGFSKQLYWLTPYYPCVTFDPSNILHLLGFLVAKFDPC